ncbi:MAG: DUF481 domain-containing protein [Armatimonadetes bacterium]|nr:DUF481 domain-containing protein [Armatimonadota bacterium]
MRILLAVSLVALVICSYAQDGQWKGSVGLSLSVSRATKNSEGLDLIFGAQREQGSTKTIVSAAYLFAKQDGATTTDAWFANADQNFALRDVWYGFVALGLRNDRINLLDLRTLIGGGLGYRAIRRSDMNLSLEAGATWVKEDFVGAAGTSTLNGRAGYLFDMALWNGAILKHDLTFLPKLSDFDDYYSIARVVIEQELGGAFTVNLLAIFDYDSTPAPGAKKATSRYILALGKKF